MSTSICCRRLAFSTSAQFGAFGVNQLLFAAWAVASLPATLAASSSRFVALGSAALAIRPCWDLVLVKSLIHSAARSLSLLGSWCADCTAPSSQPLPYIIAAWPWPKMASWSFSSLVTSPFEYFLTRSAHFFRPSTEADSDSVPFHLSPSFLAIWPPLP